MRTLHELNGYYTLQDGTEIQIVGHTVVRGEDRYHVRYPDRLLSGETYELTSEQIRKSKPSTRYEH
jgi:hypothetical protein